MKKAAVFEDLGLRDYKETWDYQEELFQEMLGVKLRSRSGDAGEQEQQLNRLLFVEHPHVFTLGKSGSDNNLLVDNLQLKAKDASFYRIDRGGDITYHGPGQLVGYPLLDLEMFGLTLKAYIHNLEEVIILSLKEYGIEAGRSEGATGVWLDSDINGRARKICAIGVRASRHITMHGLAFNVNTDLDYFSYINPCGYTDKGVTSLAKELGEEQDLEKVKHVVKNNFKKIFGIKWVSQ
ncbi:MAG: lipoyl(octanoyl) transferase LipB [Bacteroidales bacterium]|nr:lipoyl(octanoyl) transferase LipB [Bacteroidales bacterium]